MIMTLISQTLKRCLVIATISCFVLTISAELGCYGHQECPSILDVINSTNNEEVDENICSIYLSPSSAPGAGMGIFTVKKFHEGDVILNADGPNVPIIDPYHIRNSKFHWTLFESYWWAEHAALSPEMRFEADNIADYQITFGALPNFHTYLHNLGFFFPEKAYNPLLDEESPARGAYSYHTGRTFYALREIEAGEEIFLDYGESFLNHRSYLDHVPRYKDFALAGDIIFDLILSQTNTTNDLSIIKKSISNLNERLESLLPSTKDEFYKIYDSAMKRISNKPERLQEALSYSVAQHKSLVHRSIDDIKNNGYCLDNIYPRPSTVLHAGSGAFAQRFISKGQVIVPVPLLHMVDARNFVYNKLHYDTDGSLIEDTGQQHSQLLLNYCFGHRDSTILMCPTTNAILINHNATPNAVVRWADWDETTNRWRSLSLKQIENEKGRGLSLEIVALRDIKKDEEIFIDYGKEWEEYWNIHIERWKNRPRSDVISPSYFNETTLFPLEQQDGIFAGCIYKNNDTDAEVKVAGDDWRELVDDALIKRFGMRWTNVSIPDEHHNSALPFWPCQIIEFDSVAMNYTVQIFQHHHYPKTSWKEKGIPRILTDVPKSAIKYFHKPYHSDLHLSGSFRHYIPLPDHLFPLPWKNRCLEDKTKLKRIFSINEKVTVNWKESDEWHPATISRLCVNGLYEITYVDGEVELNVGTKLIRRRKINTISSRIHPYYPIKK